MNTEPLYRYRHLAHIVIEAKTPLVFGSGEKDILTDNMIAKDANGLPYIPGSTLAGTLRHALGEVASDNLFGFNGDSSDDGLGSRIIFSEAKMLGPVKNSDGSEAIKVLEGLLQIDWSDDFYRHFKNLPVRQHVRIGRKGTVDGSGKFDEQIIVKGTRFCFDIEIVSDEGSQEEMEQVLDLLYGETYTLGSGSRSGFGKISVESIKTKTYNLTEKADEEAYLNFSSSLNSERWTGVRDDKNRESRSGFTFKYTLELEPDNFFLFGSGRSDDDADMTPVREDVIEWTDDGKPRFVEALVFIPASSVKGALAHRTAFHYNRKKCVFSDRCTWIEDYVGSNNEAVREIFGTEGKSGEGKVRGKALFSDIFKIGESEEKILNHVAIDSFTGGAVDGALFSEKVLCNGPKFTTEVLLCEDVSQEAREAFEAAVKDLCSGMLPLGGGANRGHGIFSGSAERTDKNGERISIYKTD